MLIFDRLGGDEARQVGEVALAFEWRQKSRMRLTIDSGPHAGEAVGFDLPRGTVLRDGMWVASADGLSLRVRAAEEELIHVEAETAWALMRIAYHLGNRHVPLQIGPGWLRLQYDHVLEGMVRGLGGHVTLLDASFDPEAGAYGYGHHSHGGHAHGHHEHHGHAHDPVEAGIANDPGHGEGPRSGGHDDRRHAPRIHDFLTDPIKPR